MKLRFLGQTYSATNNLVETQAIPYTARFMGQSYTLRQPLNNLQLESQPRLKKYRGVAYGDV